MQDIVISCELPYPRERVWTALTDSRQLAAWLMKNDFAPVLGHSFTFTTDPAPGFDGIVRCEVLAIDPPRHLKISWRGGPLDTVVTFDLEEISRVTRLTLRHAGFEGLSNFLPRVFLKIGWAKNLRARIGGAIESVQRQERPSWG